MNTVRAKFRVNLVTPFASSGQEATEYRVDMAPVYDSNPESENAKFYKSTPWGQITLGTVNAAVAEQLKVGSFVYVDFTPAEA
jgi:hypothetical protein